MIFLKQKQAICGRRQQPRQTWDRPTSAPLSALEEQAGHLVRLVVPQFPHLCNRQGDSQWKTGQVLCLHSAVPSTAPAPGACIHICGI